MTGFPWFPIGHAIASGTVGRLRAEGPGYQVLQDQASDALILVLASSERAGEDAAKISGAARFTEVDFSGRSFLTMSIARASEPVPLLQWPKRFGLPTTSDVVALGKAVADMRRRAPRAEVCSALFVAPLKACLPVRDADGREDMRQVAAQILTASTQISSLDVGSVRNANPWVSADGRPMSDAAWVVNEAARLTARAKHDRITETFLQDALSRLHANARQGA